MDIVINNSWKSYLIGQDNHIFKSLIHTYISNLHRAVIKTNHDYKHIASTAKSLKEFSNMTTSFANEQGNDEMYQKAVYALNHVKPELWNTYTWSNLLIISTIVRHVTVRTVSDRDLADNMNAHVDFFATNFIKSLKAHGINRDEAVGLVFDNIHTGNYNAKLEFNEQ